MDAKSTQVVQKHRSKSHIEAERPSLIISSRGRTERTDVMTATVRSVLSEVCESAEVTTNNTIKRCAEIIAAVPSELLAQWDAQLSSDSNP